MLLQTTDIINSMATLAQNDHAGNVVEHATQAVDHAAAGNMKLALLIPALPILGTILMLLCAIFRIKSKLPAFITVACLGGAFVVTVVTWLGMGEHGAQLVFGFDWINFSWADASSEQSFVANFGLYIDRLTLLWMLFVTGLGTLIALYASEYMADDVGTGYCRFFAAFNLFVFAMTCLVMADNLILLYLGWEGVGLCSYLLIGYFYKKPSAVAAAKKAFIVNRIGDLGLALGIMLIFVQFGTVEYAELFPKVEPLVEAFRAGHMDQIPFTVQLIPVLLMIGAFGKSAQLPLYVWLPDAMEGPTPVSALIHAATMVTAGVFLIARMFPVFLVSEWALPVVAWVGTLTALFSATIGMAQFDIKRIMAYSTVSQLGYMFAGLGVMTSTGAAFHVFTHAFFKATLFLCCGAVMHGFAGQLDLRKISGLWNMRGWRIVTIAMLVGSLNLAGFPFTAGFFSKDMIIAESFVTPGYSAIGWILLITAGMTAYYTFRVFFRVFVGPVHFEPGEEYEGDAEGHGDEGDGHGFHPHAPGWAVNTVLGVLAISSLLAVGTYFINTDQHGWVGSMVHDSSAYMSPLYESHGVVEHDASGHVEASSDVRAGGTFFGLNPHGGVLYYVSAAFGLIGIVIAWWLHYAGRTEAATSRADNLALTKGMLARGARGKWFIDEIYDAVIRKPLWVFANVLYWLDQLLIDGLVNLFGWVPRAMGSLIRPTQNGQLHGYAAGMAGGLVVLMVVVWLMSL